MRTERQDPNEANADRRDWLSGLAGWAAAFVALGSVREALGGEAGEPAEQPSLQLKDLTQIAIVVKDIEQASKRIADLLGAKVPKPILTDPVEKAQTKYRGRSTPARAKLAFFNFGSIAVELIEPVGGPSTWKEALDKQGEGVHHVAFQVENMPQALAVLRKKGFEVVQTGDFGSGCYAYVDTSPALGTMIELLMIY